MSTDPIIRDSYDAQLAATASTEARRGSANRASEFTGRNREIFNVYFQAAAELRRKRRNVQ